MIKKSLTINVKKRTIGEYLLFFWLLEEIFMTLARYVLNAAGFSSGPLREIVLIFVASMPLAFFLLKLPTIRKNNYIPFFVLISVVLLLFLCTYLMHPDYKYFFTRIDYGLTRVIRPDCAIFAFLFFSLVDNPDDMLRTIRKYAIFDFAYLILIQLIPALINGGWVDVNYMGKAVKRMYSLSFGYAILLPSVIFLHRFMRERHWLSLVLAVVGIFFMITQGSRGSILMLCIFIGLMVISNICEKQSVSKKTAKIIGILCLLILLLFFGEVLIRRIVNLLVSHGVNSRTLEMLISGDIGDGTGRDLIWLEVIKGIRKGGILGNGVFGDRQYVYPLHYAAYSHNIVLEMVCSFGVVGILIVAMIFIQSFRMILACKDRVWRELFIIFFSVSCQLLISMSFWYVWEFWAAAAIAYKYFHLRKARKVRGAMCMAKSEEAYEK